MSSDTSEQFTKEKTLYDIFVETKKLKPSRINSIVTFVASFVGFLYVCAVGNYDLDIVKRVCDLAVMGITFSTAMLGFLISGFTVFATMTNKELFIKMAEVDDPNSDGLTYLKSFFFVFMKVFIYYVCFLFFSFFVYFVIGKGNVVDVLGSAYGWNVDLVSCLFSKICYVVFIGWFFCLVMLLKSFIFNVYHVVMTTLRYEYDKKNENT